MAKCLICETSIEPFIDFGPMPLANGFLSPEQFGDEYFFNLATAYCPTCHMVQLVEQPDREQMFHENYAFYSSTSRLMAVHFKEFADLVRERYLTSDDPLVVEIGSNDGIMLRNFAEAGIRHLGIEPSANVAEAARENGVETICEYFDAAVAQRIVDEQGHADAFLAANVMCHIPYIHSVAEGIAVIVKKGGVCMFEDPYLLDILEKTSYDQIYDEHAFYFSVHSVDYLFGRHGMEVVDVLPQPTHGGSMRYVIAHKGSRPVSEAVTGQKAKERAAGIHLPETYDRFRVNVERSRDELMALLKKMKAKGQRVVGYAATSKSTTVTNYCGITPDLVDFISDTTPIKQGKFSPGAHIPVRAYDEFKADYPPFALLFGWNHKKEIVANETAFTQAGGRWIVYVPRVEVLA